MQKPDYKQAQREKQSTSVLMPFLTGLLSGVLGSFLFYLYVVEQDVASTVQAPVVSVPPQNLENAKTRSTKFEFYTILEEQEQIPQSESTSPVKLDTSEAEAVVTGYLLQLGSFKKSSEAESLRAELMLNNYLNTYVETVTRNNQQWHRVRVGPYANQQQANRDKVKLKRYEPIVKEIKG